MAKKYCIMVKHEILRIFPIKESGSQIYSWRLKVDTKIKKWLKAGLNIYGHYRENIIIPTKTTAIPISKVVEV